MSVHTILYILHRTISFAQLHMSTHCAFSPSTAERTMITMGPFTTFSVHTIKSTEGRDFNHSMNEYPVFYLLL